MVTYYVVQTYRKGPRGVLVAEDAKEAKSEEQAIAAAARYAETREGVVAFKRTGDPDMGDWEDAVILAKHGRVPAEAEEMAA